MQIYLIFDLTTLHEQCPKTELLLIRIFLYSVQTQENTYQKLLRIWTLLMQCKRQRCVIFTHA